MASGETPSDDARAVLDRAACGLLQTSDDGTVRWVNAVFCSWCGYEASELVRRRRLQDLFTMGGRIFHQTHWSPLLRMQGSLSEVKLEIVHRDGSTLPMVLNAIRREQDGETVHDVAMFVARDRDRYEQELLRSRKRLEALVAETAQLHELASDRALLAEQMIGIVSHDLRNPLGTIAMATELLLDSGPGTKQRLVGQITRALTRANRLIMDLLDFTQARVGTGISVVKAAIDLHEAVAEILDGQRLAFPDRVFTHTRSGSGACDLDVNRLAQVVSNLVANAVAYGRKGAPIDIATSVTPQVCSFSITNSGEPIAPAALGTLFQPMIRGTSASSKVHSVGLGLFIVQEIAKAHAGVASVRSSAESGTTFTVEFPR